MQALGMMQTYCESPRLYVCWLGESHLAFTGYVMYVKLMVFCLYNYQRMIRFILQDATVWQVVICVEKWLLDLLSLAPWFSLGANVPV